MVAGLVRAAALAGSGPVIGRRAAARLARRELSRAIYQPPLTQRIMNAIGAFVNRLLNGSSAAVPGGWWGLVVLIAAAVALIAVIGYWVRPARRRAAAAPLLQGARRPAADHRAQAARLAAAGNYAAAIVESLRAIAVGLEDRAVIPPRPGRTADELAAEAGAVLAHEAAALSAAARLFDDVRYGGRPGSADGYQRIRDLDARLLTARPAPPGGGPAPQPAGLAARPPW